MWVIDLCENASAKISISIGGEASDSSNPLLLQNGDIPDATMVIVIKKVVRAIRFQCFE